MWNLEPWALESGMQPKEPGIPLRIETWNPSSTDKGSGIQYLESGIHSLESSPIHQDCLGLAYMGQILSSSRRQSNLRPNGSTLTEILRLKGQATLITAKLICGKAASGFEKARVRRLESWV